MAKYIKYSAEYYEANKNLVRLYIRVALCKKARDTELLDIETDDFLEEQCLDDCLYSNGDTDEEYLKELEPLRKELLCVLGIESLPFVTRHSIVFIKGDIFTREEVIKDVMKVVLLRFNQKGIAKEIVAHVTIDKEGKERKSKARKVRIP